MSNYVGIEQFLGRTFVSVEKSATDDEILFTDENGQVFKMMHMQDCCEAVWIESVVGDLTDLVGSPILQAEEAVSDDTTASESGTWTFYKLATIKGYVDIRWCGQSNGYYSEGVDIIEVTK